MHFTTKLLSLICDERIINTLPLSLELTQDSIALSIILVNNLQRSVFLTLMLFGTFKLLENSIWFAFFGYGNARNYGVRITEKP